MSFGRITIELPVILLSQRKLSRAISFRVCAINRYLTGRGDKNAGRQKVHTAGCASLYPRSLTEACCRNEDHEASTHDAEDSSVPPQLSEHVCYLNFVFPL